MSLFLGLTEKEKNFLANREKGKGNEAFYSGDYEEAVMYYTRSVGSPPLWLSSALPSPHRDSASTGAALPEEPGSVLASTGQLSTCCNSSSRGSNQAPSTHAVVDVCQQDIHMGEVKVMV